MKKRPYIMVVDDGQTIPRLLGRILEPEGYDVVVADNGRTALELLQDYCPDLVILDIMMSGLDGFQVLNLIRQRSNIPVIMLTGRCEVTTLHDALALGADDYVRKPFSTRELLARIRAKLRRDRPRMTTMSMNGEKLYGSR
jgi:DNA-binding response OmpR family regulator